MTWVPRHTLWVRIVHWVVAISFLVLMLTGLALFSPYLWWLTEVFGGGWAARVLHPWAGVVFAGGFGLLALRWLTEMLMGPRDFAWFRHFGKYLSHQHDLPEAGKFNPGQKLFFWTAVGTTVGLLLSGLLLWFPGTWTAGWLSWARTVHAACFVLITVGFIYHLYLSTVAFPGTLRAMTRGTVSRAWARLHHAGWLNDQDGA